MQPLGQIRQQLQRQEPPPTPEDKPKAAVAAILRPGPQDLELLFIERSHCPGDPWSGHLAFPGGRIEPGDPSSQAAAERETQEEIGWTLSATDYVGHLDTLTGVSLPIVVIAHLYHASDVPQFVYSSEVQSAFWAPVSHLTDPKRRTQYQHRHGDQTESFEATDLLGPNRPLLWGITYRFTQTLLRLIAKTPSRSELER